MTDYPNVNVNDIRIFSWSSKPKAGFQIGTDNGVHVIHLPTGLEFKIDSERSQHKNKDIALSKLTSELKEQGK